VGGVLPIVCGGDGGGSIYTVNTERPCCWLPEPASIFSTFGLSESSALTPSLFEIQLRYICDLEGKDAQEARAMVTRIWRDEVQRLLVDEAAQLIEVLPPPEFEAEHMEGAINIPLKNLNANTTSGLDKDRPVIVY